MNNCTGRSRHSPRHCPVSADAIASQLVRNGKYEAVDRKSSRFVSQEVSDLWRATTPDAVNISDNFSDLTKKIIERLIYARVEPLIDSLLLKEQAGFRRGKSTVDQVVLLTQNTEDSFEAKKKAGAVFIDLTAAYDTVWHRGLTCKQLRLLPYKHMVGMIMELVRNRSFTLMTGDSKQSKLRRLKNGVPQGSVLAPLLFNIYMYDLPSMISRKFAYADDLALLHSSGNWKDLEGTLSQDISTLSAYLQTWRLKLSHTKTVTAAFHLNNRETKRELKVYNNGRLLPFCPTPTYFGVKLG